MAKEYEEVSNQICKNINNQMCEKLTTPFTRYAALRVVKEHHFQDPDLKHYYKEVDGQIELTEIDDEGNTFFHKCARLTNKHQLLGAFICTMNGLKVELVSKELNHLAAILHVYAGGLNFMK